MNEQELQQQIVSLIQAAMSGDQQATQQIQQIVQAAQQGDQRAIQLAQMIQAIYQQMQGQQTQAAKFGAKLNHIKKLRGQCPDGYDLQYFKAGGQLCKKCIKKQQEGNPIEEFKKGGRKGCSGLKIKMSDGSKVPQKKKKQIINKAQQDEATKDSIAVNKYNDQEIQVNKPGDYKKNAQGKVQWTPDRTKYPYKKK